MKGKKVQVLMGSLLLTAATVYSSCIDNEYGVVDLTIDEEEVDDTVTGEEVITLSHPCALHTSDDFTYVKEKIAAGESPWAEAYEHLCSSTYAQSSYTASPQEYISRMDNTNWGTYNSRWEAIGYTEEEVTSNLWQSYTYLMRDAAAAYQLALRWKLSDEDVYAATAVQILDEWAATCKGYVLDKNPDSDSYGEFPDPNENLIAIQIHEIANAAEILRDYDGWSKFSTFQDWFKDTFYDHCMNFLAHTLEDEDDCATHEWLNWDLASLTGVLGIGVVTDNVEMIQYAVDYYRTTGTGSGFFMNAVPYPNLTDPHGNSTLGQCQESNRDQGHAVLCVSLMGAFCQMAKNVGVDLFLYPDNEAWALQMCEYVAKYNIGTTETGSTSSGWTISSFSYTEASLPNSVLYKCDETYDYMSYSDRGDDGTDAGRGNVRPAWELVSRLASDYGLTSYYSDLFVTLMRQNSSRGYCDGGGGDYGPNSSGFDQLGYGTLMFAKGDDE